MVQNYTWKNVPNTVDGNPAAALAGAVSAFTAASQGADVRVGRARDKDKLLLEQRNRAAAAIALDADGFTPEDQASLVGQDVDMSSIYKDIDARTLSAANVEQLAADAAKRRQETSVSLFTDTPGRLAISDQQTADKTAADLLESASAVRANDASAANLGQQTAVSKLKDSPAAIAAKLSQEAAESESQIAVDQAQIGASKASTASITAETANKGVEAARLLNSNKALAAIGSAATPEEAAKIDLTQFGDIDMDLINRYKDSNADTRARIEANQAIKVKTEADFAWEEKFRTDKDVELERKSRESAQKLLEAQISNNETQQKAAQVEYDTNIEALHTARKDRKDSEGYNQALNKVTDEYMLPIEKETEIAIQNMLKDPELIKNPMKQGAMIQAARDALAGKRGEYMEGSGLFAAQERMRPNKPSQAALENSVVGAGLKRGREAAAVRGVEAREEERKQKKADSEALIQGISGIDLTEWAMSPDGKNIYHMDDPKAKAANTIKSDEALAYLRDNVWGKLANFRGDDPSELPQVEKDKVTRLLSALGNNRGLWDDVKGNIDWDAEWGNDEINNMPTSEFLTALTAQYKSAAYNLVKGKAQDLGKSNDDVLGEIIKTYGNAPAQ